MPIIPEERRGVEAVYVGRTVKVLHIFETEVEMLSSHNTSMAAYFSAASGALSLAAGIEINRAFYTEIPPAAVFLVNFGVPVLGLAFIFCVVMGVFAWLRKNRTLTIIRSESPNAIPPAIFQPMPAVDK